MEASRRFSKHFSHEHPLQLISPRENRNRACAACRITIMPHGDFYHCKPCDFSLHKACYTMPRKVVHPADPDHCLNLTVTAPPVTDQSNSDCRACGKGVGGFHYSCTKCCLCYHMLCVALPLSVKIPSSHPHLLRLEIKPPYDFRCDLCDSNKPSYKGWLYRCRDCEFDAHVSCAVKGTQSLHQRSVSSLEHEVMELLSEAMKGSFVNSDNNLDHDQSAIPVSEDFTYQFSDVCFSIDISKSILFEENRSKRNIGKLEAVKTQSFDNGGSGKELKRELSLAPVTGIASHVWEELGSGDKGKIVNSTSYRMQMKDQTNEVNMRRSFLSKFFMCS